MLHPGSGTFATGAAYPVPSTLMVPMGLGAQAPFMTPYSSPYLAQPFGLPSQQNGGPTLDWDGLQYTVTVKKGKLKFAKPLLNSVFGCAKQGEVLAIMGSSGAGKTTLLDALAGRLRGRVSGEYRVNGIPMPPGVTGGYSSAYVLQGENLHPCLTAWETLWFAAQLHLPGGMPKEEKNAVVLKWINLLKLSDAMDVKVGDEDQKGLSGGQRRRLSVGIDLLRNPQLIFLDEPISGLDSTSAFQLIEVLHGLAKTEARTVVLTIHQPSPRMVRLLDSILVMGDGYVIFQGSENNLEGYLQAIGQGPVPEHVSPIEYFMDVVDELKEEGEGPEGLAQLHRQQGQRAVGPPTGNFTPVPQATASLVRQLMVLTYRNFVIYMRVPELLFGRWIFLAVQGFLISTIFWNLGTSFDDVESRNGFFLIGTALLTFTSLEVLPLLAAERQIFRREYARRAYGIPAYAVSHSIIMVFVAIIGALLFTLTHYWCVGLWTDVNGVGTFLFSWLLWFCILFASSAFAMLISGLFISPMTGTTAGTAGFAFMLLLAGYFVKKDNIPPYWIWFHYLSHYKYSIFGFIPNYFGNQDTTLYGCAPPNDTDPNCKLTGQDVITFFDMKDWDKWYSVVILLGLGVGWRMLYCIILYLRYRRRN